MGILAKKVYRDLMRSKGRSLSIILIITLSSALYGGLLLTYINAQASFDNMDREAKIESVRYSLNDFVNIDNLTLNEFNEIEAWDYRIATLTTLRLDNTTKESFTAPIFGVEVGNRPKVNDFHMESGSYFESGHGIIVINQFTAAKDLEIGDDLYLDTPSGKAKFSLMGTITSPEYIYNVNPISGLPDLSGLASTWIAIDTLREKFNLPSNSVNEVLVRFKGGVDDEQLLANRIKSKIATIAPLVSYTLLNDEGEQKMRDADVGMLDDFARVFGIIILLLALFIMYDSISKMIASQRNYIGTMRALGGDKAKIVLHYTSFSAVLALIGVVLGIPLGYEIGDAMVQGYSGVLGIPTPAHDFYIEPFYESMMINFGLAMLIAIMSSIGAARVEPREAMASSFITMLFSAKPFFERLTSKIPGLNSPSMTIPFRLIFRQKRRTTLTILTYAISMLLMMSSLGFMDSFAYGLNQNYTDIQKYDMEAHFITPVNPDDIFSALENVKGIKDKEFFSTGITDMVLGDYNKSVPVDGYLNSNKLRAFNIIEGKASGLVLGSIVASNFNVSVGDSVKLYNRTYSINGITSELIGEKAFLPLGQMQDILHLGENVTSMMILAKDGVDFDTLKNDLIETDLPIGIVIVNEQVKKSIETMIQGLIALIGIMILIGFLAIALFSFNTIILDVISREQEFINLRTLGAGSGKILKVIATQAIFISILGSIIAVPLSYYSTVFIMDSLIADLMVLPIYISVESYASGIISAIVASFFGVLSAWRRIMKINLAEATRNRVSN